MNREHLSITTALSLLAVLASNSILFADQRPNIIVIMADDMGYADTGFTGSTDIHTPNLDKLAASGVTFSSGYVTHPYCGPSRAGLLSGRYRSNAPWGVWGTFRETAFKKGEVTLGTVVKDAGYRTGFQSRVKQMRSEYLDIFNSRQRTAPAIE